MNEHKFNPDLELSYSERAQLAQVCASEGYRILHRILSAEVDKFFVALLNADPAVSKDVLAKQALAKAAAQFYEGATKRVNEEVLQFTQAARTTDRPVDITEGVLDIGDMAEDFESLPNFFDSPQEEGTF